MTLKTFNKAYLSSQLPINRCISNIIFDIESLDFHNPKLAVETINGEVSQATEGKISQLLQTLHPDTKFVLLNAVFFKGLWNTTFDAEKTHKHDFLIPPGRVGGRVDMMSQVSTFNHGEAHRHFVFFFFLILL